MEAHGNVEYRPNMTIDGPSSKHSQNTPRHVKWLDHDQTNTKKKSGIPHRLRTRIRDDIVYLPTKRLVAYTQYLTLVPSSAHPYSGRGLETIWAASDEKIHSIHRESWLCLAMARQFADITTPNGNDFNIDLYSHRQT